MHDSPFDRQHSSGVLSLYIEDVLFLKFKGHASCLRASSHTSSAEITWHIAPLPCQAKPQCLIRIWKYAYNWFCGLLLYLMGKKFSFKNDTQTVLRSKPSRHLTQKGRYYHSVGKHATYASSGSLCATIWWSITKTFGSKVKKTLSLCFNSPQWAAFQM